MGHQAGKLFSGFLVASSLAVPAQESSAAGNVEAGRTLALLACTGCHVVLPNQPFAPLIGGLSDFYTIANRPNTTQASLRRFLSDLPAVPPRGRMANPALTSDQMEDIVAFIMSLRDRH
jgi:mono/diheme cytochrome c family protein